MGGSSREGLEEVKKKILELIDDAEDQWLKAAFYGDAKVSEILNRLFEKWEEGSRSGIPLDYASKEELETLYSAARKYASMSQAELQAIVLRRMGGGKEEEQGLLGFIKRIVRGRE